MTLYCVLLWACMCWPVRSTKSYRSHHWQRRQRMGPHSTSEQEPRARLSLRDARFADWQFSSEGHMVARPGGTLAGRLRTPFKARVRPRKAVALPLGSQSPGTCL